MNRAESFFDPGRSQTLERESQVFSHFPAIPPPLDIPLLPLPDHPCPYLPGRTASDRAIWASAIPAELYEQFMDCGFRRSGKLLYQPACRGCRSCIALRVPVARFHPNKSQRRCARRNLDLHVTHAPPASSAEKFELYQRYVLQWHGRASVEDRGAFETFLYESPLASTLEFEYRDSSSRLLAVGICDLCPRSLSSVYFYFDPAESRRGLGTFGALYEIQFAASRNLEFFYLGFWVDGCPTMQYKGTFRPNQILGPDAAWRSPPD